MSRAAIQVKICKGCQIQYNAFRSDSLYCSKGCGRTTRALQIQTDRSKAIQRASGACERCRKDFSRPFYRDGLVLCGKCQSEASIAKFRIRVPNPEPRYAKRLYLRRKIERENCKDIVDEV